MTCVEEGSVPMPTAPASRMSRRTIEPEGHRCRDYEPLRQEDQGVTRVGCDIDGVVGRLVDDVELQGVEQRP